MLGLPFRVESYPTSSTQPTSTSELPRRSHPDHCLIDRDLCVISSSPRSLRVCMRDRDLWPGSRTSELHGNDDDDADGPHWLAESTHLGACGSRSADRAQDGASLP